MYMQNVRLKVDSTEVQKGLRKRTCQKPWYSLPCVSGFLTLNRGIPLRRRKSVSLFLFIPKPICTLISAIIGRKRYLYLWFWYWVQTVKGSERECNHLVISSIHRNGSSKHLSVFSSISLFNVTVLLGKKGFKWLKIKVMTMTCSEILKLWALAGPLGSLYATVHLVSDNSYCLMGCWAW